MTAPGNLLVTNTRHGQAYAIIRALRPYCHKIVATIYGKNRFVARLSPAANSRLVDKRYVVPSPVEDWQCGRLQRENTEAEEAYVRAVLQICEQEKIDTVFPSFDPHIYVFAKNRHRFEERGVWVPVPDYDTVIRCLDKLRVVEKAQQIGFPCPRTYVPSDPGDSEKIAAELGFPLVVRPRLTSGSRGLAVVTTTSEFRAQTERIRQHYGLPMVQEYIPGRLRQNFHLVLDKKGQPKSAFAPKPRRIALRLLRSSSIVSESSTAGEFVHRATELVQHLGWWGGMTVQTKIDARDESLKLMEVNPRLGTHLWYATELGVNVPLACLKVAGNQEFPPAEYPLGKLLLDPVEDSIALCFQVLDRLLYSFRTRILKRSCLDPMAAPESLQDVLRSYRSSYGRGEDRVWSPYFRHCLQDPLVATLWWLIFLKYCVASSRKIGR